MSPPDRILAYLDVTTRTSHFVWPTRHNIALLLAVVVNLALLISSLHHSPPNPLQGHPSFLIC